MILQAFCVRKSVKLWMLISQLLVVGFEKFKNWHVHKKIYFQADKKIFWKIEFFYTRAIETKVFFSQPSLWKSIKSELEWKLIFICIIIIHIHAFLDKIQAHATKSRLSVLENFQDGYHKYMKFHHNFNEQLKWS